MTQPLSGSPELQPGSRLWLFGRLKDAGLSNDEARGVMALNEVEGGFSDPSSTLGFTQSQLDQPGGPEMALKAFLEQQWRPRTAGGVPGVSGGRVTDWRTYLTFLREQIVGQKGVVDWQGVQQPPAAEYQMRLESALAHYQGGGDVGTAGADPFGSWDPDLSPIPPPPVPGSTEWARARVEQSLMGEGAGELGGEVPQHLIVGMEDAGADLAYQRFLYAMKTPDALIKDAPINPYTGRPYFADDPNLAPLAEYPPPFQQVPAYSQPRDWFQEPTPYTRSARVPEPPGLRAKVDALIKAGARGLGPMMSAANAGLIAYSVVSDAAAAAERDMTARGYAWTSDGQFLGINVPGHAFPDPTFKVGRPMTPEELRKYVHHQDGGPAGDPHRMYPFPLFTDEGPQYYDRAYAHNLPFSRGAPYETPLTPEEERQFQQWAADNGVEVHPPGHRSDYDMRGYWKDGGRSGRFYPDTYKTPYDTSFSNLSKYATQDCPFRWRDSATLIDIRDGSVVFFAPSHYESGPAPQQDLPAFPAPDMPGHSADGPASQSGYSTRWHVEVRHADGRCEPAPLSLRSTGNGQTHWNCDMKMRPGDKLRVVQH